MAFAETQDLAVRLNLEGNYKRGLQGAIRDFKAFDKATSNTQRSLGKFGSNIGKLATVGLAATAGGFLAVTRAAADYESAFAGVRKTVDATDAQLDQLSDSFRKLAKEIPISASELARLGEAGGALGVPTEQLEEFVRVTALLGVTTDLTADQAADALGILSNVLHLTGDEYEKFASSLVALGNAGASTESQIVEIAARAGAAGELIGLSTDQVLGFSSAIASLGIEIEAGGTSLQKFFIDSAKFIAEGGEELEIFAKVSGKTAKTFQTNFEKNAGNALRDFLAGLGKLTQAEQLATLEALGFNDARITRALLGLANNTELVADQMKVASDAFRENTALTKEAEERFKTFDSQLQITKNVLTDIGITIGSKLLPKLTPLLKQFNDFINQNQGAIEQFGDDLAAGFERFADAVGKTDWTPFIDGLKLSASLAKGAFDAFNALPDDFKKLILVGAGINKITGGLITSVGKDLAGALGSQFLARGSSPANPLWVQTVGGPLGGGPGGVVPGGGGGGIIGGIGKVALGVTLIGVAAEAASAIARAAAPGEAARIDAGDTPLANRDPRRFNENGQAVVNFLEDVKTNTGNTVRVVGDLHGKLGESSTRQNIANERLDAIRGYTASQAATATATLAANERLEAINAAKAEQVRAQIAAGDTRTELALGTVGSKVTTSGGLIQGALNAAKASIETVRAATDRAAAGIRDTRSETAAVRRAVQEKDLSVTVNTSVSVRAVTDGQTVVKGVHRVAS